MSSLYRLGKAGCGVVAHAFNPNIQEAEADGAVWIRGLPGLHSKFQDS